MRAHILPLTGFLLITLLIPAFLAEPCTAAYETGNNITLERDGMTWEYQEQITGKEAVLFRNFIDLQAGNDDNFVNAWEILKAETVLRNQTKEAIKTKPDVKLNGTSEPVKVTDVDFWLSKEALGKVEKNSSINNSASVSYIFEKEVCQGTEIWFMGTPDSSVTITLPVGLDVKRAEGLENKSQKSWNNRTVLEGNFGLQKNITLWISENESSKAGEQVGEGNAEQDIENKSEEAGNKTETAGETAEARKSSGSFKDIFARFYLSPKS
ncbi:hypothetical protein [Methanosarcina sp.]|uniref:hypothetical protein n=1 Tax=Methanosarcina sp. TaxID=2213 RepID=UPI003C77DBC1